MPRIFFYTLVAILLCACGSGNGDPYSTASSTQCPAGTAMIGVQDGVIANLCGCREESGNWVAPPNTLTCTIPTGTTLIFQYIDTTLMHQIVPVGTPAFQPSPVSDPDASTKITTHTVKFTESAGTDFQFQDNYNQALKGVIQIR